VENVKGILEVPYLETLNIGHSIVARAVFVGLEEAVRDMIRGMQPYSKREG
jgi:pyridoxine 5-phosphate synthase